MKWSAIKRGPLNIKPTRFTILGGQEVRCGLRPLAATDEALALQRGAAFATSRGGKAADGDKLYELGKAVHLLVMACTDLDDPTGATPFFESAEQVCVGLDALLILALADRLRCHLDDTNPRQGKTPVGEFLREIFDAAASEEGEALPYRVVAAANAADLAAFYGRPACELSAAAIAGWIELRNVSRRAERLQRKG